MKPTKRQSDPLGRSTMLHRLRPLRAVPGDRDHCHFAPPCRHLLCRMMPPGDGLNDRCRGCPVLGAASKTLFTGIQLQRRARLLQKHAATWD
jgi:hypothetical protein